MIFDPEAFSSLETSQFRAERKAELDHVTKTKGIEPASVYENELRAFRMAPFGTDIRWELCMNCMRMQWPGVLLLEINGYENTFAKRQLKALNRFRIVNFLGGASTGKTFMSAAYCYTFWKSSPWNTSIFLTTTSASAGEARTWGALKDLHKSDVYKLGKRLDYLHLITLEEHSDTGERDYRDSIAAVLIKPGNDGKNVVGAICGRKNQHVIWQCDEMPFLDVGILEARLNLLSNPFHQFIGIGNKPSEGDPLYLDAEPKGPKYPDGWKSIDPEKNKSWFTKSGICLYFDGEKSPNFEAPATEAAPFPRLLTREMREAIEIDSGGTDSPGYWTQVRGFPRAGDVQDTVLTVSLLRGKGCLEPPNWSSDPDIQVLAGLDLGFRKDGDPCVADFAKLGKDVTGRRVLAHETDTVQLIPAVSSPLEFPDQIAHAFIDHASERNCHSVCLDISSDGGITSQAIERAARERKYVMEVIPISFMGTADERVMFTMGDGKRRPAKELFDRKVSQLWYSYRLSVQAGVIFGVSEFARATKQLCARKVSQDEDKRWKVEKKEDMKKRIKRSPDDGDARALVHENARRKGLSDDSTPRRDPDNHPARRQPQKSSPYQHGRHSSAYQR